jgi:ribosomal protein S18 acetylase RimI-like enzyme
VRVTIRAGKGADWQTVQDIYAQCGRRAWTHILPPLTLAALSAPDRWHPGTADVLVAQRPGEIQVVGFVCVRTSADKDADPTVGEIDACYVLPSAWGTGVGHNLLSAAIDHLSRAGFTEATLWTEQRNERALRFYRRAAWAPDGTKRRHTFHGAELLEIRHRLVLGRIC